VIKGIAAAGLALTWVLVGSCLQGMPSGRADSSVFSLPKQYYLSLGDSVAFGYQESKQNADVAATGTADPATFTTGFSDDFGRMLRAIDPGIQVVNLACPGESTVTYMNGGCPYPFPLHTSHTGSQQSAALAFLKTHAGQVGVITLFMGANDILQMVDRCGGIQNINCVTEDLPATLRTLQANLSHIISTLQAAAPDAELILLTVYNPFASAAPVTNVLAQPVLDIYGGLASQYNLRLVDMYTPFNLAQPQPETLCADTFVCGPLHDIHPTDIGYLLMAKQVWAASGYDGLGGGAMVSWNSGSRGSGEVYFGPSCSSLVEVATRDMQPWDTQQHSVFVTGNDMPGTVGDNGIIPGVTYYYETVTITSGDPEIDDNGGKCYALSISHG
jgi:lysophospholipase L1-like esterase